MVSASTHRAQSRPLPECARWLPAGRMCSLEPKATLGDHELIHGAGTLGWGAVHFSWGVELANRPDSIQRPRCTSVGAGRTAHNSTSGPCVSGNLSCESEAGRHGRRCSQLLPCLSVAFDVFMREHCECSSFFQSQFRPVVLMRRHGRHPHFSSGRVVPLVFMRDHCPLPHFPVAELCPLPFM